MSENQSGNLRQDLQWKLIGASVGIIVVLQVVAYYAIHYPLVQSLSLTVLLVSYIIVPRAKARKFENAVAGVIFTWIIGVVLDIALNKGWATALKNKQVMPYIELMVVPLLLGIAVAYGYMRLTNWSARKRTEIDNKRKTTSTPTTTLPARRVHTKKKRKK
jgi:hypothetical protein